MNWQKRRGRYMGEFGGRKGKGDMHYTIIEKIKNNLRGNIEFFN